MKVPVQSKMLIKILSSIVVVLLIAGLVTTIYYRNVKDVTIHGYVYDRMKGDNIPHATISINLFTYDGVDIISRSVGNITSDDNGFYSITLDKLQNDPVEYYPHQEYHLTATHNDFISSVKKYGHNMFENKIDFYLEPGGPIPIEGVVYDRITGDKIPHATISISLFTNGGLGQSSQSIGNITSDDNGFYSVTLPQLQNDPDPINVFPYQEYHLAATHKNFISSVKDYGYFTFEKKIDFYLEPGGLIKGVVYDEKGNPLTNSSVGIYSSSLDFIDIVRTSNKGEYQINQIRLGTYNLIASCSGYDNFIKSQITFKKGDELNENIYMNGTQSNITLKGEVSYIYGTEYVKLMLIKDNNDVTITTTDKDGNFESTLFSTGDYAVKAIPYGSDGASSTIENYIHIDVGENYETIVPLTVTP